MAKKSKSKKTKTERRKCKFRDIEVKIVMKRDEGQLSNRRVHWLEHKCLNEDQSCAEFKCSFASYLGEERKYPF